jgi:hypothetical protein
VDLFHYVKRNFSLPAYKLDYVCQHFMSGKAAGVDTSSASKWIVKTKNTDDVVVSVRRRARLARELGVKVGIASKMSIYC